MMRGAPRRIQLHLLSTDLTCFFSRYTLSKDPSVVMPFKELLKNSETPSLRFIVSREYQLSSALSYWTSLRPRPWPHSLENPQRNQWRPEEEVRTGPSVFVCELWDCEQSRETFRERFSLNILYLGEIDVHRESRMVRNLLVYWIE